MSYERLIKKLREKGWSEQDIQHTIEILSSPTKGVASVRFLYWVSLFVGLIANFFISIFVIPFLLIIPTKWVYLILAIISISLGMLFNSLLNEIESLGGLYVVSVLFIPSLVLLNAYLMIRTVGFISQMTRLVQLSSTEVSTMVTVYSLIFILPFAVQKIKENVQIM